MRTLKISNGHSYYCSCDWSSNCYETVCQECKNEFDLWILEQEYLDEQKELMCESMVLRYPSGMLYGSTDN